MILDSQFAEAQPVREFKFLTVAGKAKLYRTVGAAEPPKEMENYIWIFWTILGAILIIAEIFTTGFVLLWFGIGALAAALAGLLGVHSITLQFLIFAVVSIALTAASRTIFVNYFSREKTGGDLKTGMDALPGKMGTVVSSSRGALHEGAVKVFGSTWTAYPVDGEEPLEAGDRVQVERVQGASIYVRRVGQERDWRGKELGP